MLLNDITLAGDASSSQTYSLISVQDGNSVRRNSAAPSDAPQQLIVKHESYSKGSLKGTRHLVRLERTRAQATSLTPVTGSVHLVIDAPGDTVTAADLKDMFTQLKNLLTAGVVTQVLNGEP
jgi:hypothetical protein